MDPFRYFNNISRTSYDPSTGVPTNTMGGLFAMVLNIAMGSAIAIAVISIGIAGIKFVTSRSDPKATDTAKKALTYGVLAFILALGAFALKVIILNLVGVTDPSYHNGTPSF